MVTKFSTVPNYSEIHIEFNKYNRYILQQIAYGLERIENAAFAELKCQWYRFKSGKLENFIFMRVYQFWKYPIYQYIWQIFTETSNTQTIQISH